MEARVGRYVFTGLHFEPEVERKRGLKGCELLLSVLYKQCQRSVRVRTPSVPDIVITYLPTVVDRVVVTVRMEVEDEPGERVTVIGTSEEVGRCVVKGEMEVNSLTVAE